MYLISADHCLAEIPSTAHPFFIYTKEERVEYCWQAVIEHRCQSCGTWRRRLRYQHCCGRSQTLAALFVVPVVNTRQTRTREL